MLTRPFVALYISVFVATMGISMVSPLLPVYAEELGANGVWLGLTFSSFAIVQTICGPIVGQMSDRYTRKPFIVVGLLIYMIAALGYLTANSFVQVIAFRTFSGLGTSMIFSVARAYVGDLTPRGQEGRWFGFFATADVLGFGTGPLLAGLIREGIGFRSVFVCMASMMAASALIVVFSLPGKRSEALHRQTIRRPDTVNAGFRVVFHDRLVLALTLYAAFLALSFGASFSFLGLRLEDDIGASPALIGLAFSTQDITGGLAQPLFGRLADRVERRTLVIIGLLSLGVLQASLGMETNYWLVVLTLFGMGASNGLAAVSASAIQVVAGRRIGMGTMLGLNSAGNGAGIVVGSVVGGLLVTMFSIPAAFIFGGLVIGGGAALFLLLTHGIATRELEVGPALEPIEVAAAGH